MPRGSGNDDRKRRTFVDKICVFAIFCLLWWFTPLSTWVTDAVTWCVPRSMDRAMGSAADRMNYRIVNQYSSQLDTIGRKLLSSIDSNLIEGYDFTFKAIDENYVNAFAYPGGRIFITDEMITDLKLTDDEIAAVLAHEIGHVINRHSIKRMVGKSIIFLAFQACFYEDKDDNDGVQDSFGEKVGKILIENAIGFAALTFSRENEFEADNDGWEAMIMSNSGFNPTAMISMFEKLLQMDKHSDGLTHWHSTHPGCLDRIARLKEKCERDLGQAECRRRMSSLSQQLEPKTLKQPAYKKPQAEQLKCEGCRF